MTTGLISMSKEKTPVSTKPAYCKLCSNKITTKNRILLMVNETTYIGYVHEYCLRHTYDILLVNKI